MITNLLGFCAVLGVALFGGAIQSQEVVGMLKHSDDHQDVYLCTEDGQSEIDLFFLHDDESLLIIDDFDRVEVSGPYFKLLNVMLVEEITESAPALAHVQ